MAACQTFIVIQNVLIDLLADGGPCRASSGTTEEGTQQTSSQAAKDRSDRASDEAEGGAGFSTAQCSGGTPGRSGNGPDGSSGFTSIVASSDASGITTGTGKRMNHIGLIKN
jgi:hypothetical protein